MGSTYNPYALCARHLQAALVLFDTLALDGCTRIRRSHVVLHEDRNLSTAQEIGLRRKLPGCVDRRGHRSLQCAPVNHAMHKFYVRMLLHGVATVLLLAASIRRSFALLIPILALPAPCRT